MSPSVLVIDDNPQVRKVMRVTLESRGCGVREAPDAATALTKLDPAPDLILQDLLLPDMDGLELLEQLRNNPGTAHTPVIAISGFAPQLFGVDPRIKGFAHRLQKPVAPSQLLDVVEPYLARAAGCASLPQIDEVVDDREVQLAVLASVAEALLRVGDPEDAIEELLARCLEATGLAGAELRWSVPRPRRAPSTVVGRRPFLTSCDIERALQADRPVVSGDVVLVALRRPDQAIGVLAMGTPGIAPDEPTVRVCAALAYQLSLALALAHSQAELYASREQAVERLAGAIELRDGNTADHTQRMSRLCASVGERLGLGRDRCEMLRVASALHDVGKIAVPDRILHKPGPLTAEERAVIETHAQVGHDMLAGSHAPMLDLAALIALCHHERWDGSGYPQGLHGDDIPLEARIAAVADVYDALVSDRPYRAAMTDDEALAILKDGRGGHFDPDVVDALLAVVSGELCSPPALD